MSFRLGAANAYAALFSQRVGELREEYVEGSERISVFLNRRFAPAMATCASLASRLDAAGMRIDRVSALLRTRVDVAVERQNSALLRSMNERAAAQLRLQQTVEGLSVLRSPIISPAYSNGRSPRSRLLAMAPRPACARPSRLGGDSCSLARPAKIEEGYFRASTVRRPTIDIAQNPDEAFCDRVGQAIIDRLRIAPRRDQSVSAQLREVLRQGGLAKVYVFAKFGN